MKRLSVEQAVKQFLNEGGSITFLPAEIPNDVMITARTKPKLETLSEESYDYDWDGDYTDLVGSEPL